MGIEISATYTCDICGASTPGISKENPERENNYRHITPDGWATITLGEARADEWQIQRGYVCPTCRPKLKADIEVRRRTD